MLTLDDIVVEHWRILITFIRLVHDREADGYSICNSRKCPKMSAGPLVTSRPI